MGFRTWLGAATRSRALKTLSIIGLLLEGVYLLAWVRPFYLPDYYAVPLLDLGKLTNYSVTAGLAFLGVTVIAFGLYYVAFRLVRPDGDMKEAQPRLHDAMEPGSSHRAQISLVVASFGMLFCLTLALVYPWGAADIFDYLFYGRMIAHYGVNPFIHSAAEFANDPLVNYVAWRNLPFTYGPWWAAFSAALSKLAGADLLANLIVYKGVAIASYAGALWLIHSILGTAAPRYQPAGLLLFAWSPLVLSETAANGHNDSVMMVFVLAGIRLAMAANAWGRPLGLVFVTASALIKFVTGMLGPLFAMALWLEAGRARDRLLRLAFGGGTAIGLTVLAYIPFWNGSASLAVQRRDELFTASIPAVIKMTLESRFGVADAKIVGTVILLAFGGYCLVEAWRLRPGIEALIAAGYRVILIYLLFACLWFQPWYLVWLVTLAAVRPRLDSARLTMLFCFTATLNYFVFDYLWIWNADRLDFLAVQFIAAATIYTLPISYALFQLIRARSAHRYEVLASRND